MTARRTAFLVVDLGFGDAGKGLLTDYLVRRTGARLVVRFNGGAQAGHNVVTADGRQHTFSQFGAGTLVPGARTHLARAVVVHPTALGVEAQRLQSIGESDVFSRISVDPRCPVTTPFQQAAGRLRELLRGQARHGSCGVGVGETVRDALDAAELTVQFGQLTHPAQVRDVLFEQRALKASQIQALLEGAVSPRIERELAALTDPELPDRWLQAAAVVARQVRCVHDEALGAERESLVFEGAQGVLLDERYGFHPHTTFSKTTFDGALQVLGDGFDGEITRIGVLRSHAVRHGAGPFPTEDERVSTRVPELHNELGPWQAHVRKGWPDLMLLDYAVRACGGVDALAITHLDALRAFAAYQYCTGYTELGELRLPESLAEQAQLAQRLFSARPQYQALDNPSQPAAAHALCELFAQRARAPVAFASYGPTANDVISRT